MYKSAISGMCKYILIIITGVSIGIIPLIKPKDIQDFKIIQSYNIVSGNYIDTSIYVITTTKEYKAENKFTEIRDFHNTLNGEPDKLTIYLYNSKEDYEKHNYIDTKTYYKERR